MFTLQYMKTKYIPIFIENKQVNLLIKKDWKKFLAILDQQPCSYKVISYLL